MGMKAPADSRLGTMNPIHASRDERQLGSELGDRQPSAGIAAGSQCLELGELSHFCWPTRALRYSP